MMIAVTTHDAPACAPRLRMEHRWGERMRCVAHVHLGAGTGTTRTGRMRDVSMSGAFFETSTPLPPFTRLTLSLSAAEVGAGAGVDIEALVVRTAPDGVGVEWCDTPQGSFCSLLGCAEHCKARTQPLRGRYDN